MFKVVKVERIKHKPLVLRRRRLYKKPTYRVFLLDNVENFVLLERELVLVSGGKVV